MPTWMIHLTVAKKVNRNAEIDFYIGNLAPDSVSDNDKRHTSHFRKAPDREAALKEFALKLNNKNEYLKGVLLHLFTDLKWDSLILPDCIQKNGDSWYRKYYDESGLIEFYMFHNTKWAYELWEQMDLCDNFDFFETQFIKREDIKEYIKSYRIRRSRNWEAESKTKPSTVFPPPFIEKFANDTAADFEKWLADLVK